MTWRRDDTIYLDDIVEAAGKALHFTEGLTLSEFKRDTAFAVVRALEVLGEAARNVPQDFRDRAPHIPWQEMAGMRDKLIRAYHGVDLQVVWRTLQEDLPATIDSIRRFRNEIEDSADAGSVTFVIEGGAASKLPVRIFWRH